MAGRCGSLSRSLLCTARTSIRSSSSSSTSLPGLRRSLPQRLHSRPPLLSSTRTMGELGCAQSLMPLHSAVAAARLTSHISIEARAFCELSQGS
ncbi:hypothetical protein ACB098_02G156900 [Castanea mollissima]